MNPSAPMYHPHPPYFPGHHPRAAHSMFSLFHQRPHNAMPDNMGGKEILGNWPSVLSLAPPHPKAEAGIWGREDHRERP